MAEFKREEWGIRFTIPDAITVRQQLKYFSTLRSLSGTDMLEVYWEAGKLLIEEWECEALPDKDTDLGEVSDLDVTQAVIWAGSEILMYMNEMGKVSKNSSGKS